MKKKHILGEKLQTIVSYPLKKHVEGDHDVPEMM
jgi:hypothetical protein